MLLNIKTKERIDEHQFRLKHSNVSFPVELTDAALSDFGYAILNYPSPLTPSNGNTIIDDGVECINGLWFVKYGETPIDSSILEQEVRMERNVKLAETDWTQVLDSPVDRDAWAAYRQELRDITNQVDFPFNVIWPNKPI